MQRQSKPIDGRRSGFLAVILSLAMLWAVQPVAPGWAGEKIKGDKPVKSEKYHPNKGQGQASKQGVVRPGDHRGSQAGNQFGDRRQDDVRDTRDGRRPGAQDRGDSRDFRGDDRFSDHQRRGVHEYYREQYSSGHCPPGLAKKNNGCMPPGQAKKWRIGRPLPHDVRTYELSAAVIRVLGPPPAGCRYVRVSSDILMISIGTRMIVDAIDDLSHL
ncbi:MAG: hypothetical protein ACK5PS_08160 [Desulfopila sp.]